MQPRDLQLLLDYMEKEDFSQARLARYADTSRQFIHMLVTGERRTCTRQVGERIEEALRVLPGTLFVPSKSPERRPDVANKTTQTAPKQRRQKGSAA